MSSLQYTNKSILQNTNFQNSNLLPSVVQEKVGRRKLASGRIGYGGLLAALCVSCLFKTCKHILSCTEYYVCEQEVLNARKVEFY